MAFSVRVQIGVQIQLVDLLKIYIITVIFKKLLLNNNIFFKSAPSVTVRKVKSLEVTFG
jgi:hypothetical protein